MATTLRDPTVAEMIAALQALPPDAKLMVIDPDTDGHMRTIHVGMAIEHRWAPGAADEAAIWTFFSEDMA